VPRKRCAGFQFLCPLSEAEKDAHRNLVSRRPQASTGQLDGHTRERCAAAPISTAKQVQKADRRIRLTPRALLESSARMVTKRVMRGKYQDIRILTPRKRSGGPGWKSW
jgi:hypothetical protein